MNVSAQPIVKIEQAIQMLTRDLGNDAARKLGDNPKFFGTLSMEITIRDGVPVAAKANIETACKLNG